MQQNAFSLLELMIVISIVAIMAVVAIPSFQTQQARNNSQKIQKQLKRHLELAKSEAVALQSTVTICGSSDGVGCQKNWRSGYILFHDQNKNGMRDPDETLIRSTLFDEAEQNLTFNGFISDNYLQFFPSNLINGQNGSFNYTDEQNHAWKLIVSKSARIRHSEIR